MFLENFYSKTHKFTVKSNSPSTDWIVDPFQQVKSAEHMAKINTKIICLLSGAFPNSSWKPLSKIYKTSMKHIENTSWKVLAYGIYARVVHVSEILLVRCAHSFDFWYKNNECVNTVQSSFHVVLCLLYTYWDIHHLVAFLF